MYDERCLKIIGANIKLLRTCRGISQGELARALVISQTHLSNIECCRVAVNFRVLLRAANALEYTLDDLLQLEFTELTKTVMEVREYFSAQDGYALNVTGKLVIKEKSPEPEPPSDNYDPSSDSKYTGTLTNVKAEKCSGKNTVILINAAAIRSNRRRSQLKATVSNWNRLLRKRI
ncbi:MAG: helix-turn-helix domain-containing protein [Phascolarctobacterium faecium]